MVEFTPACAATELSELAAGMTGLRVCMGMKQEPEKTPVETPFRRYSMDFPTRANHTRCDTQREARGSEPHAGTPFSGVPSSTFWVPGLRGSFQHSGIRSFEVEALHASDLAWVWGLGPRA